MGTMMIIVTSRFRDNILEFSGTKLGRVWVKSLFQKKIPSGYLTAMENCPFIDDFPIKTLIYKGFSMAMLNNQRVYIDGINMYRLYRRCKWC
jgi:hypothetical protein